jgi:hypothetical protein
MMKAVVVSSLLLVCGCGVSQLNSEIESASQIKENSAYIATNDGYVEVQFEKKEDYVLVGGDMKFPASQLMFEINESQLGLARMSAATRLWPNGRVPYALPANFPYSADFEFARAEMLKAGIQWVPKTDTDADYVQIVEDANLIYCGTSYVGRIGGAQALTLPTAARNSQMRCSMRRTILHEMGHAVGFMHEHQRADRDDYVKFEGSIEGQIWLQKLTGSIPDSPLDLNSIMMYGSSNTRPRMVTKAGALIPLANQLSAQDIAAMRTTYASFGAATPTPTATPQTAVNAVITPRPAVASTPRPAEAPTPRPAVASTPRPTVASTPRPGTVTPPIPASARCLVRGGGGKELFNQQQNRQVCIRLCSSFQNSSPNRSCFWGNEKLK